MKFVEIDVPRQIEAENLVDELGGRGYDTERRGLPSGTSIRVYKPFFKRLESFGIEVMYRVRDWLAAGNGSSVIIRAGEQRYELRNPTSSFSHSGRGHSG